MLGAGDWKLWEKHAINRKGGESSKVGVILYISLPIIYDLMTVEGQK